MNITLEIHLTSVHVYFHGPVILSYILKTVCWTNAIIGILVPCDAKIYLIKYMWVSDLDFVLYLEDYLMD